MRSSHICTWALQWSRQKPEYPDRKDARASWRQGEGQLNEGCLHPVKNASHETLRDNGSELRKKFLKRIKLPGIIMLKRTAICREGKKNLCLYNLETLPNWLDRYSNTAKLSQRLEMSPQNSPFLETHRPAMFAPHHGPHNGAWLCIVPPILWESWLERLPEEWSPQATPNPACQLLCQRFGSASSDRVP